MRNNSTIMNKGEKSTFMLVLYDGQIGIYLQDPEEIKRIKGRDRRISCKFFHSNLLQYKNHIFI